MSIPKIIHYVWFGDNKFDALINRCVESFSKYNPSYEVMFWNNDNFSSDSQFFYKAKELKLYRKMSNYARLSILYKYGGIYLDTDIEVIKSFDTLLNLKCFFGSQSGGVVSQEVNNSVIGAVAKNKFIGRLLKNIEGSTLLGNTDFSSGPELVTKNLLEIGFTYPILSKAITIDGVTVFPNRFFNPFLWNQDPQNVYIRNDTYTIHWWWSINSKKYKIPAVLKLLN
jgi:mannosyltransferase OCH1-like enzyme